MSTGVRLAEHIHLALVVAMFLAGSHTVSHGLVHLVAGVNDRLYIFLLQILLGELGYLLVGNQFATRKDRLSQLTDEVHQQLTRIDNGDTGIIGPSCRTAERDAGIECRAGCCRIVKSLLHRVVSHTNVRTVLQHHGRHADMQILGIKHLLLCIALSLSMVQYRAAPLLAVDMLRGGSQQLADGILDRADITTHIHDLRLHTQIRSLHLVNGGAIGLTVLPERLLRLQRLVPDAISLHQDFQLTVQHLQQEILLCGDRDEVGARSFLLHLSLQ